MAANTATLIGTQRSSWSEDGHRTYTVEYRVETTDASDQGITARRALGIPRRGQYYVCGNDFDLGAFVKAYSESLVDRDGTRKYWGVLVEYSSKSDDKNKDPEDQYDFPWDEPAKVSGAGSQTEQPLREHYAAGPGNYSDTLTVLDNSADDFFDDQFYTQSHPGLTVEKNYKLSDWDYDTISDYVDTVNDAVFFGKPIDFFKLALPVWSLLYTGEGTPYINCRYEFEGNTKLWNDATKDSGTGRAIDEGYRYRDASGNYHRFEDDQFRAVGGKGLLDGTGNKLSTGDSIKRWKVNPYKRSTFANLSIPTSLSEV